MDKLATTLTLCLPVLLYAMSPRTARPFPLKEFFNKSDELIADGHISGLTCDHHISSKCCYCDRSCVRFKDCCIAGSRWESSKDLTSYVKTIVTDTHKFKDYTCQTAIPFVSEEHLSMAYLMIGTCEDGADAGDVEGCIHGSEKIASSIPVTGDDGYLYKNLYCAKCNRVKHFEMVPFKFNCKRRLGKLEGCWFEILTGKIKAYTRRCDMSYQSIRNCPPGHKFYDLCRAFKGPMGRYANYFCYLCNDGASTDIPPVSKYCQGPSLPPPKDGITWSSLLQFSDEQDEQDEAMNRNNRQSQITCDDKNLYDAFVRKCIPFLCPAGYRIETSGCSKSSESSESSGPYRPTNTVSANFDSCLMTRAPKIFIINVNDTMKVLKMLIQLGDANEFTDIDFLTKNNQTVVEQKMPVTNKTKNFLLSQKSDHIVKMLGEKGKLILSPTDMSLSILGHMNPSHYFPRNRLCAEPKLLEINAITFTSHCKIFDNGRLIHNSDISMWIEINKKEVTRNLYTCVKFYLTSSCPLRVLKTNISIVDNGTLVHVINDTKAKYDIRDYVPLKSGGYGVCVSTLKEKVIPQWMEIVRVVEIYVSMVGSSISMISFILIIFTYSYFHELRNVPSLYSIALCICLFLGDTLFLIANVLKRSSINTPMVLCQAIGIVMHYSLVSAHYWSVVLAIDIFLNICSINLTRQQTGKTKFIKHGLIVFTSSLVVIAASIISDKFGVIDVRYERDGICALQGFYGRVLFYIIPVITSFFISLCVLSLSLYRISRENRRNENAITQCHGRNVNIHMVALKLILICGLPEAIGFINIPNHSLTEQELIFNSLFALLYSCVKSFRGVLLFGIYFCKKRVIDMYRKTLLYKRVSAWIARSTTERDSQ